MALPGGFRAKKFLGQHFLQDEGILDFEAERLACEGMRTLEIGAGDGRLSAKLLSHSPSTLVLLEIDRGLAAHLKKRFCKSKNAIIAEGDALGYISSPGNWDFQRVCGNIPYKITGPLFALLAKKDFEKGVFCVQKEVAERLCASPGTHGWGRLSVAVQLRYDVKTLAKVPAGMFSPPPKVDSAVIELSRKTASQIPQVPDNFESVVSALFCHRLQSVGNAVVHSRAALSLGKEEAKLLAKTIIYHERKVFTLSVGEIAQIAPCLEAHGK